MKSNGKGIVILFWVFSFFTLTAFNPSKALAVNAAFDVKKMGDMSDFDPNNPGHPHRRHHQDCRGGFFFRPGGFGGPDLLDLGSLGRP